MKNKLSTYDISYIMKKFRLKTVEDFAEFGLILKKLGKGCSRIVYYIRGYDLVVKIPLGDKSSRRHAAQEHKAYSRIANKKVKKYNILKKYLPEIYCYTEDGVILMKKYKRLGGYRDTPELRRVSATANFLFPENGDTDTYWENLGRDSKGNLVILDFGCYFSW
jgi:hypothetical protein